MGFQKLLRWLGRAGSIAAAGALLVEAFALLYGVALGLVPDPPYNQVGARVAYSLFVVGPVYLGIGLVLFLVVGAATRQPLGVVLERSARTLALVLPLSVFVGTAGGALCGALLQTQGGAVQDKPGWLNGVQFGMLCSFPLGLLLGTAGLIWLLRREPKES